VANIAGKSYALTAITRMQPFKTKGLEGVIGAIKLGMFKQIQLRLIDLSFIHFARWVIIKRDAFPWLGPPQEPEDLRYDYLLFCSNFNGPWESYIAAFSSVIPGGMDNIWRWSVKYPMSRPLRPLLDYIRNCQYQTTYYYNAYPGASTNDIKSALALEAELGTFARSCDGLAPDEFEVDYFKFLTRVQGHLGSTGQTDSEAAYVRT